MAVVTICEHDGRGAVGDQRAIGALERTRDIRVLVAFGAAELVAEILAHLRPGIVDPVLVVLGGDRRQAVGLVAVFLEVAVGDLAEDTGEARRGVAVLRQVGGAQQIGADLRPGRRGHLLDADHQQPLGSTGTDRLDALVHGGGTGGAGVLDTASRA
jgi:hypothetical protein